MPKDFEVEKSILIPASPSTTYNILNDISLQKNWNPWLTEDETMKVTFSENTIGKGAAYTYSSEKYGNGSEMITNNELNKSIDLDMAFEGDDPSKIKFMIDTQGGQSKLSWKLTGRMGFPSNVFGPIMKWQIGKSMNKGLANISAIANDRWKNGKYYGYEIKYDQLPERHFVLKRKVVSTNGIQQFYLTNLGSLFQAVQKSGIEMDGMPCGLFYAEDKIKSTFDMAAAIPVIEKVDIENAASLTMAEGEGLIIDHYGDYSGLPTVRLAVEMYMRDREMVHQEPFIEEYLSDPSEEDDPDEVLTRIYYYLADTGIK
jgi:effector-binding domain-containing protein